jgi:hypothetical protein
MDWTDALNWYALAAFAGSLIFAYRVGLRLRTTAFWFLVAGFLWSVVVRAGISFNVPFFEPHSRPLTAITATLFFIGMAGLDVGTKHFPKRDRHVDKKEQSGGKK